MKDSTLGGLPPDTQFFEFALAASSAKNETSKPGRTPHSQYFKHIDGLRALAILPVVLYHLFPSGCPGGFAGVDVFFVISGFLITRGIVSDLDARRFSIADFYVRRIKRILPAYFVLIAFVLTVLPFFYSFYKYRSVAETAIYSAFYSANIYFNSVIGYFDVDARENPLLHLWSLGVEEQFYLIIPLFLWILWRVRRNLFLQTLIFLFATSLAFSSLCLSRGHSEYAFFMLPSRAWELLAGSIVSQIYPSRLTMRVYSASIGWAGLALILIPYAVYNDKTPFPGMAAIPSVLGTSLLILHGNQGPMEKLLSWKPAIWVGRVSYSLYLWHWPIFIMVGSALSVRRAAVGLIGAAGASILSYRFVELPIRRNNSFRARQAFTMLVVGSCFIAGSCYLIIGKKDSRNGELPLQWNGITTWVKAEKSRDISRSSCSLEDLENPNSKFLIKIGKVGPSPTFALWGDSFALALLPGVDKVASEYGRAGYFVNIKHGFTLDADIGAYPFKPKEDREPVLRWLESRPDISDVFLVNNWFTHVRNDADIRETIGICERLRKAGKHIFFFNDAPFSNEKALYRLSWGRHVSVGMGAMSCASYVSEAARQTQLANELSKGNLATVIPINKAFLDGQFYYTCTEDQSYYVNFDHLNQIGAIRAMHFAAPMIWSNP